MSCQRLVLSNHSLSWSGGSLMLLWWDLLYRWVCAMRSALSSIRLPAGPSADSMPGT